MAQLDAMAASTVSFTAIARFLRLWCWILHICHPQQPLDVVTTAYLSPTAASFRIHFPFASPPRLRKTCTQERVWGLANYLVVRAVTHAGPNTIMREISCG